MDPSHPEEHGGDPTPKPEPPKPTDSLEPFLAPLDPNWKAPTVSPEMVAMVKDIEVPNYNNDLFPNLRADDGSILYLDGGRFGGMYASNIIAVDDVQGVSGKLFEAWHKAYKSYIPKYDKSKLKEQSNDYLELKYARAKDIVDTLGPIKIVDVSSPIDVFDDFGNKYINVHENLGVNTYRFRLLNPIYNKVGKWWVGDKGQPIMAVPNNMDSYDSEPVVPKSYDDYLTYTPDEENLINKAKELLKNNRDLKYITSLEDYKLLDLTITNKFGAIRNCIPNYYNSNDLTDGKKTLIAETRSSTDIYRIKTPLEFMSPYNPDVLVSESKLNELAKEHPEVWKPMMFEYKGYKSICVSENGYIISAYQPAPNVFLPIHIYGLSDHRGPYGYDAIKSVIITIQDLVLEPSHDIYDKPDTPDSILVDSNTVKQAYNDMLNPSRQH